MKKGDYRDSYAWVITESFSGENAYVKPGMVIDGSWGSRPPLKVSFSDVVDNPAALAFAVYGDAPRIVSVEKGSACVVVIRGKYLGNPQCTCGFSPLEYCRSWGVPCSSIYYEIDGVYRRLVRATKMFSERDVK